jgi:hypothetical protein
MMRAVSAFTGVMDEAERRSHRMGDERALQSVVNDIADVRREMARQEEIRVGEQIMREILGADPESPITLDEIMDRMAEERAAMERERVAPAAITISVTRGDHRDYEARILVQSSPSSGGIQVFLEDSGRNRPATDVKNLPHLLELLSSASQEDLSRPRWEFRHPDLDTIALAR